jgi:hypothetical protein
MAHTSLQHIALSRGAVFDGKSPVGGPCSVPGNDERRSRHLSAAGSKGKECKEEELDSLPRSWRAKAGRKRDEGREKPKRVLPPR